MTWGALLHLLGFGDLRCSPIRPWASPTHSSRVSADITELNQGLTDTVWLPCMDSMMQFDFYELLLCRRHEGDSVLPRL